MQKDNMDVSKISRTGRVYNESTSKLTRKNLADTAMNIPAGTSYQRATMGPSDFSSLKSLPRRRIKLDRASPQSTQRSLDVTQTIEPEHNDTELMLLYNEYLQNILTEVILKKKAQETKELIISQLARISKECDDNEDKLCKLKTREKDVIYLTKLQNDVDSQIIDVNNSTKSEYIKTLNSILSELYSLLQPLDMIRCNNIILPETPEKWEEMNETLKSCSDTLKSIINLIGNQSDSYQSINNNIKDFSSTFSSIENHQKRLEEDMCNLQGLVMKTASFSLIQKDTNY